MGEIIVDFGLGNALWVMPGRYNPGIMPDFIQQAADLFNIHLNKIQAVAFETYLQELADWNQRINLTAIKNPDEVRTKHFLDSVSCLKVMRGTAMQRVIDVGSGAGFPGLPLKIVLPDIDLALVEATQKKAAFLTHMVEVLELSDVTVVAKRAEEVGQMAQHRAGYDWAIGRAVASMPALAEYLLPLVRVGGFMLAQKGASAAHDAEDAALAFEILGGRLAEVVAVDLPGMEGTRYLVVVEKIKDSPAQYPRRAGMPTKRPL